MSQTIDTKVVEMQFDNSKFEKNVEVSLNSLKNLNKSIDEAGKNRNSLDELAKAGDHVGVAFDNMNMKSKISLNMMDLLAGAGTKAFNKISDAVAGFALNMANSLSGMQAMRDGFAEYELKMGSVQTILAGAKIFDSNGKSIEDEAKRLEIVNQKLEDLNAYSDKTIYSFKDMTSNIGKFTNAGVSLDDSVQAIQGVANVAAVSGANANEASRAMYNFSQALSSGAVKLIDWKSIENANMATVEFKQQLLDTAVAMGTVVKEGDMYQTTTTDAQGKVSELFNSTTKFNDALSNQWMTTEVLTQTLKNYSTDVNEMSAEEVEAYKTKLKSIGYTDKQVEGIVKLSKKAFAAATEVKTFSQMIDTLKESLGSGWAQSFEIIFGDFKEAKALWTGLNNAIDGILSPIAKTRNEILKLWKEDGGRTALINSFSNLYHAVVNLVSPLKALWKAFTPNTAHTGKILATISKWIEKLTAQVAKAAGFVGKVLATLLKPVVAFGNIVGKGLVKLVGIVRSALSKVTNFFKPVAKAITTFTSKLEKAFDKQVTSRIKKFQSTLSKTFEDIKKHVQGNAAVQKLILAFNQLKENVQDLFGRVLKNAGGYADRFAKYLGKLWDAVAPLISSAVVKAIGTISNFALPKLEKALTWVTNRFKDLTKTISKIDIKHSKLYKGLLDLPNRIKTLSNNKTLNSMFTSIKGFGSDAVEFLSEKFKSLKFNIDSISMPKGLGDVFDNIKNFIKSVFGKDSIDDQVEKTADAVEEVTKGNSVEKLTAFQTFLNKISEAFEWLKTAAQKAKETIADFINFIITNTPKAFKAIHDFIAGDDGIISVGDLTDIIWDLSDALSMMLRAFGILEFGKAAHGLSEAFGDITETFNNFLKSAANKAKMEAIKNFAISIGILAGALYILAKIPKADLLGAVSALGIVALGLVKFFDLISSTNYSGWTVAGNLSIAALFLSIGAAMIGVASAVGMLVGALALFPKVIKQYNNLGEEFRTGMDRVKEVLKEIFEYLDHSISGKYALRSSAALFILVETLKRMRKTILDFAKEESADSMETGLLKIKVILNMLSDFLNGITLVSGLNIGINFNSLGLAAMIWALGDMLKKIVPVLQDLGSTPISEIKQGMTVVKDLLNELSIFLIELSVISGVHFKSFSGPTLAQWIGMSLTITMIAGAIRTIVGSIDTLTTLASGDKAKGYKDAIDTIQGIFIGLSVLMGIIGLTKPVGAGLLFMLAVSISLITACIVALTPLADKKPQALLTAVGATGAVMVALGITLMLAGQASGKTTIGDLLKLVIMSGVMLVVIGAMRRLAKSADPTSIVAAGAAIALAAVSFAGAIGIINAVSIHPLALVAMAILAFAIWQVVSAIKALKGSSGEAQEGAANIDAAGKQMEESFSGVTEHMGAIAKDAMPQILSDLGTQLGESIKTALGDVDIGTALRNMINTIKTDAKNWAQDFLDIGTNIVDGLSKALEDPANAERVKTSMAELGKACVEGFKNFLGISSPSTVMIEQGGYVIDGLVQGLMTYPEKLSEWIEGIGQFIIDGISKFFEKGSEKGKELIDNLGEGIQNGKESVKKKASELGKAALDKIGKAKEWGNKAVTAVSTFGSKIKSGAGHVGSSAKIMVASATSHLSKTASSFGSAASSAVSKFGSKLRSGAGSARSAASALVTSAKSAFNGITSAFTTFGRNAAEGFRQGIHSMISAIAAKAAELVRAAKNAAKREQNSNSPSKDFMEYGNWAAEGYAMGLVNRSSSRLIEANAQKMVNSAKNIASSSNFGISALALDSNPALRSLAYAMGEISESMDNSIDSSPTIRPVIDMSNVDRNASLINAMFGDKKFAANIGSITRSAQNGFNSAMSNRSEILSVEAINKLAKKINTMTETMNSRSLNNYITIDGSTDPEGFADDLIRSFRLNARTV